MDVATLLERIQERVEHENTISHLLHQSSREVSLEHLADCEEFPVDEHGHLHCDDPHVLEELRGKMECFFKYDNCLAGGRAQRLWPHYLATAYPCMKGWSLVDMITALCMRTWVNRRSGKAKLQYVEYFCGRANLSRAAIEEGFVGVSLDVSMNPNHNVLEGGGLRLWLLALSSTVAGALIWVGCPCSSFVVLCRSVTKRYEDNMFLGDENHMCVLEGNVLGDISGLMLLICFLLDCQDGFEQPQNSVAPESACLAAVLAFIQSKRTITYHYLFGGNTLKPLQLWSSQEWMLWMHRPRPSGCVSDEQLVDRDEGGAFTGIHSELFESQHYTMEFGRAIIKYWLHGHNN